MRKDLIFNKDLEKSTSNFKYISIWLEENYDITSTLKFIKVMKQGISLILIKKITSYTKFLYDGINVPKIKSEELSQILGQKKYHIKNLIKKATINSNYIIALNYLTQYEHNLRKNLSTSDVPSIIIESFIVKTIKKYRKSHKPPFSNRFRSKKFHPKLIENYFETIDSVEKAYWLGLLWADGWISETFDITKKYPNFEIGLKQCKKNYSLIRDYCLAIGFNQKYLNNYLDKKSNSWSYSARFMNSRFAIHLMKRGFIVGNGKSLNIKLPNLIRKNLITQKELYLGFILGYYDGDGTTGRTKITSGSYDFLMQIKDYFNINNKITEESYKKQDNTKGVKYRLELGRDLMALMLFNYGNSFKLKRLAIGTKLANSFNKLVRIQEVLLGKGKISKNQFQDFIWKLGHRLEFSYKLISDKSKDYNIDPPSIKKWESNIEKSI